MDHRANQPLEFAYFLTFCAHRRSYFSCGMLFHSVTIELPLPFNCRLTTIVRADLRRADIKGSNLYREPYV